MKTVQPGASGRGQLLPVTGQYILDHRDVLIQESVPVYRVLKNESGELRAARVSPSEADTLSLAEREHRQFLVDKDWKKNLFASDPFAARLEEFLQIPAEERSRAVGSLRSTLADLKAQNAEPMVKARAIMDTVSQTFLLNKASLKLRPQDITANERSIAKDSSAIVTTALEMAEDPSLVSGLFLAFQGLSNGQTVNHVARVFASYSGFLRYYNAQHQRRLSQTLRRIFPTVYRPSYRQLLPHLDERLMISDHVLQLPAFQNLDLREFALGAFLHDIGKMGNIDYFESDASYDAQQIQQHVFVSAGLILMNYGNDHDGARLLAGDHHNALGHAGGYGLTRWEKERGARPPVPSIRSLASDPRGFVSGEALGWLPVEMLAVVDVFDAMTDNSRIYKKAMGTAEAVVFLEDTLVAQGRLDPVMVDLYIDFLRAQNVEVPKDRGLTAKAQRT